MKNFNYPNRLKGEHKDINVSLDYNKDNKHYYVAVTPCTLSEWGTVAKCFLHEIKTTRIMKVDTRRSKATDQAAIRIFDTDQAKYLDLINDEQFIGYVQPTPISKAAQDILKPEWDKMQEFLNQPCQTEAEGAFAG